LGKWQAKITLPAIFAVVYDRDVAAFVLPAQAYETKPSELKLLGRAGNGTI
jgi:hypothetical protein